MPQSGLTLISPPEVFLSETFASGFYFYLI